MGKAWGRALRGLAAALMAVCLLAGCAPQAAPSQFSRYALDGDGVRVAMGEAEAATAEAMLHGVSGRVALVQRGPCLTLVRVDNGRAERGVDLGGLGLAYNKLRLASALDGSAVALSDQGAAAQVYIWLPEYGGIYPVGSGGEGAVWSFSRSGRYFLLASAQLVLFDCKKGEKRILDDPNMAVNRAWVNDRGDVLLVGEETLLIPADGNAAAFSLGDDVLGLNERGEALTFRDGLISAHRSGGVRQLSDVGADYELAGIAPNWASFLGREDMRVASLANGEVWTFPAVPEGATLQLSPAGDRLLVTIPEERAQWAPRDGALETVPWQVSTSAQLALADGETLIWLEPAEGGRGLLKKAKAGEANPTVLYELP